MEPLQVTIEFLGPISNHATICEPIHEAFDDQPTESVEICLQVSTFNDTIEKTFSEKEAYNFQAQMTYNINFLNSPHLYQGLSIPKSKQFSRKNSEISAVFCEIFESKQ